MIEIIPSGGSSVKISTKNDTLWVDPRARRTADKTAELKNAVQIATLPQLLQEPVGDNPQLEGPGEYEVGPFALIGTPAKAFSGEGDVTNYRLEVEGVAVAILGNGPAELSEDQLEAIGVVDVLLLPMADGVVGLNSHQAAQLARRVDAKAIVPIGVAVEDTTQEPASDTLHAFVKELAAQTESGGKLKIKSIGDIPAALTVYLPE